MDVGDVSEWPIRLAPHYSAFRVSERLLLTGHSHQAWPDCAERGHQQAFSDAAELVDRKWERAFAKADRVRRGFARRLDDAHGRYSLSASTHDLIVRFLSALDLERRTRIVTTLGEFHSISRQLRRLAEEGVEVILVPAHPARDVGERLAAAVDNRTAAVLASTVFFNSGEIAGSLDAVVRACRRMGAELLLDVYHQLNVVPISIDQSGFDDVFLVGGGYKYCQLGEGNCFLRFPEHCRLRPVITGWFAAFASLESTKPDGSVPYSDDDWRFAGATYEPTSHYRAAEVFDFFDAMELEPAVLRRISQHQIARLCRRFDDHDLDPSVVTRDRDVAIEDVAGFLALTSRQAEDIQRGLADRGVLTDHRRQVLRLGPAPYLSDGQLDEAMDHLGDVVRGLGSSG